jgi:hypothetical protein
MIGGEPLSFVKATKDFFENGQYGRKVEIGEFKALTTEDKTEIRDLLMKEGYEVLPFGAPVQ